MTSGCSTKTICSSCSSFKNIMSKAILVILAILLPPLAVYLHTKSGKQTLLNLVLCFLFWIPGLLHALYLILK